MKPIRKPKIGLAGVMCTPFRGDKEANYAADHEALMQLAQQLDFELHAIQQGIYSLDEARAAAQALAEWEADFVLLQNSSFAAGDFIYPFTRHPWRLGLWAVPEGPPTSEGGLPLNSFTAMNLYNSILQHAQQEIRQPVKWFYGHPTDPLFHDRLAVTVQALRPLINLPGRTVALIGGVAPTFDNLSVDPALLKENFGISVKEIKLDDVLQLAQKIEAKQVRPIVDGLRDSARVQDSEVHNALEKSARVVNAIQNLQTQHGFDAVALSCWPQFQSDYQLAVCSVMGYLNSLGVIAACEGDVTSAVSMLLLRFLTNGEIVTLMDLAALDAQDQSILLWHCGPTSPALADDRGATLQPLWLLDGPEGERTGLHNDLVLKPGSASVIGFTTDFQRMLLLSGEMNPGKPSYAGSRGWMENLHLNGEPIQLEDLVQTLMSSGYQHHYPFGYGMLVDAALEYCSWQNIQPIQRRDYTPYLELERGRNIE